MKSRNTLILLVLALCIGAYIWLYEKDRMSSQERERKGQRIFRVKADEIDRVEITRDGRTILCAKDDEGEWQLEQPLRYRADDSGLRSICNRLESIESERTLAPEEPAGEKIEEYGLKNPRVKVRFRARDSERELNLGKDTPLGNSLYAGVGGRDDVYLVSRSIFTVLDKEPKELRDRSIITCDPEDLSGVDISRAEGELEFIREGGEWKISKPVVGLGDPDKIVGMLRKLGHLRVLDFVVDKPGDLGKYGLASPRYRVVIREEKDGTSKGVLFGAPKEKNRVYAMREGGDTVFAVNDRIVMDLALPPGDFREKRLTRIPQASIERVEIGRGGERLVLVKSGARWEMTVPVKMDADDADVRALLRGITDLSAGEFIQGAGDDLEKYGLGEGATEVILAPKEGDVEKFLVGKKTRRGKEVYIMRLNSGETLTVKADFAKDISLDPLAYRKKKVMGFDSAAAVRLSVSERGKPRVVCKRSDAKEWKALEPAGEEIRAAAVKVMLTTLAHLRAEEFVSPGDGDLAQYGLAEPEVEVNVEIDGARGKRDEALFVGRKTKEGVYYAMRKGDDAVFTIPAYMADNLRKQLIGKPDK